MPHSLAVAAFVFPFKLSSFKRLNWENEDRVTSLSRIRRSLGGSSSSNLPLPIALLEAPEHNAAVLLFIGQLHVAD